MLLPEFWPQAIDPEYCSSPSHLLLLVDKADGFVNPENKQINVFSCLVCKYTEPCIRSFANPFPIGNYHARGLCYVLKVYENLRSVGVRLVRLPAPRPYWRPTDVQCRLREGTGFRGEYSEHPVAATVQNTTLTTVARQLSLLSPEGQRHNPSPS